MKTTKFLTILFALILGAAIDATAQSSSTTTATPLGDNKWSFTMPAGNVKLNATYNHLDLTVGLGADVIISELDALDNIGSITTHEGITLQKTDGHYHLTTATDVTLAKDEPYTLSLYDADDNLLYDVTLTVTDYSPSLPTDWQKSVRIGGATTPPNGCKEYLKIGDGDETEISSGGETIPGEGELSVVYTIKDANNNILHSTTHTVKIDKTAPSAPYFTYMFDGVEKTINNISTDLENPTVVRIANRTDITFHADNTLPDGVTSNSDLEYIYIGTTRWQENGAVYPITNDENGDVWTLTTKDKAGNLSDPVYLKWSVETPYYVVFETQYGTESHQYLFAGESIDVSKLPSTTGDGTHRFDGWYKKDNEGTIGDKVTDWSTITINSDCTFIAKWSYLVTFDGKGKNFTDDSKPVDQWVEHSASPSIPEPTLSTDGYMVNGWYTSSDLATSFGNNDEVTGPLTLYASWSQLTYIVNNLGWYAKAPHTEDGETYPDNRLFAAGSTVRFKDSNGWQKMSDFTVTDGNDTPLNITIYTDLEDNTYYFTVPVLPPNTEIKINATYYAVKNLYLTSFHQTYTYGTVSKPSRVTSASNVNYTSNCTFTYYSVEYDDDNNIISKTLVGDIDAVNRANVGTYVMDVHYEDASQEFVGDLINQKFTITPADITVSLTYKDNLVYDGTPQVLIESDYSPANLQFSTDGGETWSTELPKGTNVGDHFWYKADAVDANHKDMDVTESNKNIIKPKPLDVRFPQDIDAIVGVKYSCDVLDGKFTLDGVVDDDEVGVNISGSFSSNTEGNTRVVLSGYAVELVGEDKSNYSEPTITIPLSVKPKYVIPKEEILAHIPNEITKVYDAYDYVLDKDGNPFNGSTEYTYTAADDYLITYTLDIYYKNGGIVTTTLSSLIDINMPQDTDPYTIDPDLRTYDAVKDDYYITGISGTITPKPIDVTVTLSEGYVPSIVYGSNDITDEMSGKIESAELDNDDICKESDDEGNVIWSDEVALDVLNTATFPANAKLGTCDVTLTFNLTGEQSDNYLATATVPGIVTMADTDMPSFTVGKNADVIINLNCLDDTKTYSFVSSSDNYSIEKEDGAYLLKTTNDVARGSYTITIKEGTEPVGKITLTVKDYTPDALNNTNWQSAISIPSTNAEAPGYNVAVSVNGVSLTANNDGNFVVNTEGANVSVTYTITDNAGNTYHSVSKTVKIDKTAPADLTLTYGEGKTTTGAAAVAAAPTIEMASGTTLTFAATDALSGITRFEYGISGNMTTVSKNAESGEYTSTIPDDYFGKTIAITAYDAAGNSTTIYVDVQKTYSVTLPANMVSTESTITPKSGTTYEFVAGTTFKFKPANGYAVAGDVTYLDDKGVSQTVSYSNANEYYSLTVPAYAITVSADVRAIKTITTANIAELISTTKTYDGDYWAHAKDNCYYDGEGYGSKLTTSGYGMLKYVNDNVDPSETVYFTVYAKYVKSATDNQTGATTYTEVSNVDEATAIEVELGTGVLNSSLNSVSYYKFASSTAYPLNADDKFYIEGDDENVVAINPKALTATVTFESGYKPTKEYGKDVVLSDIQDKVSSISLSDVVDGENVTAALSNVVFPTTDVLGACTVTLIFNLSGTTAANYTIADVTDVSGEVVDQTKPTTPTVTYGTENTAIPCATSTTDTPLTIETGTLITISAQDAGSGVASFWTGDTDQITGTISSATTNSGTVYSITTEPAAGTYSWTLKAKDAKDNLSDGCIVNLNVQNVLTVPTDLSEYVYTTKEYNGKSDARQPGEDNIPCTASDGTTVNVPFTAKFVDADGNEVVNAGEANAYKVVVTLTLSSNGNNVFSLSESDKFTKTITIKNCTIEPRSLRALYDFESSGTNLSSKLEREYGEPIADIITRVGNPTGLDGVVAEYDGNGNVVSQDAVTVVLSDIKYFDRNNNETNTVGTCLATLYYECDNPNYTVDATTTYAEIVKANVKFELAIKNGGWTYGSYPTGDYDGYNPAVFTITKNNGQELSDKEKSSVSIFVQDNWMGANQYEENALASLSAGTYKRVYVTIPQYLTYLDEEFSNYKYTQSDYVSLTVAPKPITLANISITKTYDGSRALPTTFVPTIKDGEVLANDEVSVAIMDVTENDPSNLYPSAEASSTAYDVPLKLKLTGAQADNYVLSGWDAKTYTENHYDNNTNELQPLSGSDKTEDEQRYFSKEIAEYFTKTVKGTITNATISATATSYNGTYDRQSHNITVNVTKPTTGYTIMYGTEEGSYDKTADAIAQTDVCSGMTIYYKVSADNFDPVTGSSTITIQPKTITAPTIVVSPQSFTYDGTKKTPTVTVYDGPVSDNIDITSECEINITGDVEVGTAYVNITDKQNGNYNVSGQATFKISAAPVTITFNGNGGTLGDLYPSAPTATVNYDGTDANYVVPAETANYYTRSGYVFSGWSTVANPAETLGNLYKVGDKITINGTDNLTLYAQWDKYELQVYKNSITIYKSGKNNAVTKGQLAYRVKKNGVVMEENAPEVTVTTDIGITCSNAVGPVDFNMNPNTTDNYTVRSVAATQGGTITLSLDDYHCEPAVVSVTIEPVTVTAIMEDGTDFDDTKYYEPGTQLIVTLSQNFPIDVRTSSNNFATEKDVNGKKWTCKPYDKIREASFDLSVHSYADDGTNTNVTFAAYVVKYKLPAIGYTATAYNGEYDGEDHGITVNVSEPATGAIIKYGTAKGTYNLDEYMETNVCDGKVVYFQITAEGHEPVEDSRTITIRPKTLTNPTIVLNPTSFTYDGTPKIPSVTVYDGDENTGVDITDECNINITGNVEVGTAYVNITDKEGGNYNVSGQKTFEISAAPVTITFNGNGGTLNSTYASAPKAKIDYDGTDVTNSYTIPSASDKYYTREGYTLSGWNTVENPTEANPGESYKADGTSAIAINGADLTLYAKWTPFEYSITYNGLENATNASTNPATYTVESEAITFTAAERDHYDFGGWFSDALCSEGNNVTGIAAGSTGNKEVYAKWTPTAYNITYNGLENAINASTNPATYTVESETFTLANPTKTGYTFFGWTGSNGNTPQKSVTITKGSYGNKNYTAKWDINQYYIDLPANMEFVTANNNNGKFPYSMEVQFKVSAGYQVVGEVMYGNDELTATNGIYTIAAMPAADVTITATVKKEITATVALDGWTYGQSPNDPVVTVDDNQISTGYTITYKKQGETDDTYTETTPSNAGGYTVRAVIAATDANLSATTKADFTIAKATPTLNVFAHSYICGSGEWSAPDGFFAYRSDNSGTHLPGSWTLMAVDGSTEVSTGSYKAQFTPTDNQNYTWAISDEFTITVNNKPLPDGIALVEPNATITYDGTAKTPTIAGLGALTEGETNDYVISYANNINAGTAASYTVTGKGCYAGSEKSDYFTIAKASLTVTANNHTITYGEDLDNNGVTYVGFVNNETATVFGGELAYDYSYTKYGNVGGNYTITPKGLTSANYEITYQSGTLTVEPKEIGIAWSEATEFPYDGDSHTLAATATGLVNGDQCSLTVEGSGIVVGEYTAKVAALSNSNYKLPTDQSKLNKTFTITAASIEYTAADYTGTYDGQPHAISVSVSKPATGAKVLYSTSKTGNFTATPITVTNVKDNKTVYFKISADNYTTTAVYSRKIELQPLSVESPTISFVNTESPTYDGSKQEPLVTVAIGDKTLTEGTDYTVEYTNNTNAGKATVTINSVENGNYTFTGTVSTTFDIEPADIDQSAVTELPKKSDTQLEYNGKAQPLVQAGTTTIGKFVYSLDGTNWQDDVPTGRDAEVYHVYYKVVDDNYNDYVPSVNNPIEVAIKRNVTLDVAISAWSYGATPVTPVIKKDGEEISIDAVTLKYTDAKNNEVAISNTTPAGNYTLTVTYPATDTELEVTKTVSFSIAQATLTANDLTADQKPTPNKSGDNNNLVYNSAPQALVIAPKELPEGYTIQYKLSTETEYGTTIPTAANAGEYTVNVRYVGDGNHTTFYGGDIPVNIGKASLTIAADAKTKTYGENDPALTYTVSGLKGTETAKSVLSGDLSREDGDAVGKYAINQGSLTANANYEIAYTAATFTIAPATLTANDLTDSQKPTANKSVDNGLVYNGTAQALVAMPTGTLPDGYTIKYKLGDATSAEIPTSEEGFAANIPVGKNVGTYTVYYYYSGDANHVGFYGGAIEVKIIPAALTITADNITVSYGDPKPQYTATIVGLLGDDTEATALGGTLAVNDEGYTNTTAVGEYTLTPSGYTADNYDITFVAGKLTVEANALDVNKLEVVFDNATAEYTYNGEEQTPPFTLKYNGVEIPASEYDFEFSNSKNVGEEATVTIKNKNGGNYTIPDKTVNFTIVPKEVSITWSNTNFTYDGSEHKPTATANNLIEGDVCEITVTGAQTNVGEDYIATATGLTGAASGNYKLPADNLTASFKIAEKGDISKDDLADTQKPTANRLIYNGTAQVLVNAPEGTLPEGYTIQYKLGSQDDDAWSDNIPEGTDAGTYVVNVRYVGDNNHTDFDGYDETVTINKADVTVTAKDASKTFGEVEPEMFVVDVAGNIGDDAIRYNVARATGENVGTYAITPTGDVEQGNYKVTFVSGTFTINPKLVATPTIVLEYDKIPFDNTAKTPSIKVYDGETLITSNEYTVEYKDNINPGTATVIVTDNADGNYTVSRSTTLFTIQAVYTVIFHTAHGTAPAQKTGIVEGSKITAPTDGNMTATGYTFLNGWYTDGVDFADDTKWDFANGVVNRNLDLYAKWNVDTYTITLTLNGGMLEPAIDGNKIDYTVESANFLLPTPQKEGCEFKGWRLVAETQSAAMLNVTIYPANAPSNKAYEAVWEEIGYTITLNLDGGKLDPAIEANTITGVHFGESIVVPEKMMPTRNGYNFGGWTYNGSNLTADMKMPAANIELVAVWNIKTITVHFVDVDGSKLYDDYTAEYNTPFPVIDKPEDKDGRTFVSWNPQLPDNMPAEETTYKAVRRELHERSITFDMGAAKGDVAAPASIIAEADVDISNEWPTESLEWEGHEFIGWMSSDDNQMVDNLPAVMPDHDVVFTAQWKANTYYVTYMINDVEYGDKQPVEYGKKIALREIVKEGYTFSGWSYNGGSISNMTMPASDITLVGTLTINSYPITFYIDNQYYSSTENNVDYGTRIQQLLPEVKAPTGYSFSGWNYGNDAVSADMTMPDHTIDIKGTFVKNKYTITYVYDNGDDDKKVEVLFGDEIKPDDPKRTGYNFIGWDKEVPFNMPAEDVTITAQWQIKTFTITFQNYDGTVLQTIENVEYGSIPAYTGETPEKTASAGIGHDFEGWVDDKGNVYGVNDVLPEAKNNATYTARFTDYDNVAPTITSVTVNGIEFVDTDVDVVECIESGKMTIDATDGNSGVATIEYTIHRSNGEDDIKVYTEPVTLEPGYYVITIVATDNAGNSTEPMDVVAIVRREATLSTTEYTYTQLSGKDVVLEGLDLDGASVHSITIDGVEYTNIFKPETNALDHSLLDNVKIGSHTLHLYTSFDGTKHDTGIEFYLTVNGFVITTEQKDDIINAEGFCQGDISVVTLAFLDRDCPKYYKIKGIHDKYVPFEDWGSLGKDLGKLKFDVTDDFQPGTIEFEVSFTDDPTSNTESEFESFKVKINASNDRILKLFNDLIAIDNHDDLFTAFQWYKDGMKIEGADQQYYQSDGNIAGNYSAYVTTTSGETVKVCYVNFEDDGLSKSLKRSVNAYPNPARAYEEITLELLNYDEAEYERCVIKIVNAQGAIVATIDNCDRINTVSLPSGTYTGYVIRSGKNGDRVSFKLIVK